MTPKGQGRNPKIFEAPYLDNGARYTDGYNGPVKGNRICRVKRLRERSCHVMQKGQGRDPKIVKAPYFHNGAR